MEKLVITATTANSWIYPDLRNWAISVDDLVEDCVQCHEAGAAVVHVHLIRGHEKEIVDKIRARCDVVIQAGMSSDVIPDRTGDFEARPEMLSIILNHHAEFFTEMAVNRLHPMEELEEYCRKCREYGIRPEWEVWNAGSSWSLEYLDKKGLLDKPNILTCFFGWPGSSWSPPTADEFLHRVRYLPSDSAYSVSVMGEEQTLLMSMAIAMGGNVRVGTEDWPFLTPGRKAKNNAEIVERVVRIAGEMGREVATSSEARRILNLK
ncbi:MAG TPA: 3-keto-5-aminohexanoate cleavage protein [Treponema sp.]|nr:3-keto-5-aminohexanoate cleavage protein [Treponema sp.]